MRNSRQNSGWLRSRTASVLALVQTAPVASLLAVASLAALGALAGCSGGSGGDPSNRGPFVLQQITTGQGQVFPYRVRQLDEDGNPTSTILNIESIDTLQQNHTQANRILPVATLPEDLSLPGGGTGNNYLFFRFSNNIQLNSVLSDSISAQTTSSGLTTALSLIAYDPEDESTRIIRGRGFVGGKTYVVRNGVIELVQAVRQEGEGLVVEDPIGEGFPMGFVGDVDLVQDSSFVFVADSDNDLSTHETFDPNDDDLLIRIRVSNAVRNTDDRVLTQEVCTATTVGIDVNPADVIGWSGFRTLEITPGNNQSNVDPLTDILVFFNKPVQPADVGSFLSDTNLTPAAGGLSLNVTIGASSFTVLYYADPVSFSDLCTYRVTPAYSLPGNNQINVNIQSNSIRSVKDDLPLGTDVSTQFRTGEGPGIINAPVSPDTVYVGIGGAQPGISVIDLNGYGQGTNGLDPDPITGEPTQDPLNTWFARFNPNIGLPVVPPLAPGSSTLDAGSDGPLTLVEDTEGNTKLIGAPTVSQIGDIHVGQPLDLVFNNSNINVNVNAANQTHPGTGRPAPGNCIAVVPHPNPPRLLFPPPNPSRAIFAEEPTAGGASSLLTPGTRPDFRPRAVTGFVGPPAPPPSPPPPPIYSPYFARQQLGHFLYVLDRDNRQILVINSNRFTILDTIRMSDPYRIAFSPSLAVMAVSNFASSTVSIVDTDPFSRTFNQIIAETRVAEGPTEIAYQPDGESICVVCSTAGALTIIDGGDYSVHNTVTGNIVSPVDVVVSPRYVATGNTSNVYYAYVLNGNGSIAVYESGPNGANGIGYDDMVGLAGPTFRRARALTMDWTSGLGGVWVSHTDEAGLARVSRLELTTSPQGPTMINQNLGAGFVLPPTFRQKEWTVTESYGGLEINQPIRLVFSGNTIADVAFDEMLNGGASFNQGTQYSNNSFSVLSHSAKGAVMGGGSPISPAFMFVALADTGKIDVVDLQARVIIKTIDVPGVNLLSTYWRQ